MEKETRGDLIRTIESQKEQIHRLESRLRDVVNAYKSLLKEKDALQSSVETLQALLKSQTSATPKSAGAASQQRVDSSPSPATETDAERSEEPKSVPTSEPADSSSGNESESRDQSATDEVQQLKEQLAKIAASMSTLMEERDKMVAAYQLEKRQLKQVYEEKLRKTEEQLSTCDSDAKKLQDLCSELRGKLKQERMDRERWQGEQAVMLREAQQQLAAERTAKEDLEHQVEELRKLALGGVLQQQQASQATIERYEATVESLGGQLQEVKARLKEAERVASLPSPQLLLVQKELANVKEQHRLAVEKEQQRADQAEERARDAACRGETRSAELEKKLAELSEMVGSYERLRCQDQLTVQKLKERVTQLDLENTELATRTATSAKPVTARIDALSSGNEKLMESTGPANSDIEMLLVDLANIKARLREAAGKSDVPLNWHELLALDDLTAAASAEHMHRKCNEELQHLKEEFERYKLRAQSVLKTKSNTKDNSSAMEVEALKSQVLGMRERLSALSQERRDDEERHSRAAEELRRTIAQLQSERRTELAQARADHERRTAELERELHRHRDRTIALLAEKERELELLRSFAMPSLPAGATAAQASLLGLAGQLPPAAIPSAADDASENFKDGMSEATTATFKELLRQRSASPAAGSSAAADIGGSGSGAGLLQISEEQARWQSEVASLQRQKRELEAQLREQSLAAADRQQQYEDLIGALKEEVRRLDRNAARRARLGASARPVAAGSAAQRQQHLSAACTPEWAAEEEQIASGSGTSLDGDDGSVGLEYLKNVVLSFLTSPPDGGRRKQMLQAIATVLHFSPNERQQALATLTSSSWWRS